MYLIQLILFSLGFPSDLQLQAQLVLLTHWLEDFNQENIELEYGLGSEDLINEQPNQNQAIEDSKYSDTHNIKLNRPPKKSQTVSMAQEYKVDDLSSELNLFLSASARRNAFISKPLILKAEFKALPAVSDARKKVFEIDMSQLISFRDHFSDKQYKYVRLHEWEFCLKFEGKVCRSIELNCQYVALIANKSSKKQIKDCNFSITVANSEDIKGFTREYAGYINRLGKRNLVTLSQYVAEEHHALISFVKKPLNFNAVEKICIPVPQKPQEDALSYLNTRGKQVLEKLRHFISRQDLLNFMVDQELSDEGERQMRRIILSDVLGQTKKKGGYERSIVEALQKNLVE